MSIMSWTVDRPRSVRKTLYRSNNRRYVDPMNSCWTVRHKGRTRCVDSNNLEVEMDTTPNEYHSRTATTNDVCRTNPEYASPIMVRTAFDKDTPGTDEKDDDDDDDDDDRRLYRFRRPGNGRC
jgi:hypothetical protein